MRGLFSLAVATAAAFITQSLAAPVIAMPGTEADLEISAENTLNDTAIGVVPAVSAGGNVLKITLHNNLGPGPINAYITARDPNGAVVILKADGTWYRPNPAGSKSPVLIPSNSNIRISLGAKGSATDVTLPDYISSGRVYISAGELKFYTVVDGGGVVQLVEPSFANTHDPNAGLNWGFIELTLTKDKTIYANLSFVDFVGMLLGMSVTLGNGQTLKVPGLKPGSMADICKGLVAQAASDKQPWDHMCVTDASGQPLRVLSPNIYVDVNKGAMSNYYASYIDQVWSKYRSQDLVVKTAQHGQVHCRVNGEQLKCQGDSAAFARPSIQDIWGCNTGAFGRIDGNNLHEDLRPRVCAAFDRSTLLLTGGDVQPQLGADHYYQSSPTNHYARLVHQYEVGGRGYAFSFDDVNPNSGVDQSGTLSGANAQHLEVFAGGM